MTALDRFALFGATPRFPEPLHVGRPNVGDRDRLVERIDDMLRRRWLTNDGPFVKELEERVAEHAGVRHAIAVCNATVGLELMARAAGLEGEVIVPSFTFVASPHALRWIGLTPVFCDVDPETHNIDPAHAESLITPRTSGILGVHLWGRPCDTDTLEDVARRHGLRLLFDAAHAFSCSHEGRMIGGFGDAEVFSFHATKFFNSGEGGAIVTDDDEIAETARRMRNFGYAGHDEVMEPGTNGKMNELAAAMGLTSFESLETFVETNRRHYRHYAGSLSNLPGIKVARYDEGERCNFQYVVVEINEAVAGISRDAIVDVLRAEGVLARRYFYPGCHRMRPYAEAGLSLPHSERLSEQVLALPTGTGVNDATVDAICSLFREILESAPEIVGAMEAQPAG